MNARAAVLGRIRDRLGSPRASRATIEAEAAALIDDVSSVQPPLDLPTVDKFVERVTSERLTASIATIDDFSSLPAAVLTYLSDKGLDRNVCIAPDPRLTDLDWQETKVHHQIDPNETVALTIADFAIAETGSFVFTSSPETPTLHNFLPLHHLVAIERAKILPYFEDFLSLHRTTNRAEPRSLNYITGTSGTADIEAKNVRGAHGPRYMHVLLIG
ncbi:MAG: lactate utilization protein C [Geminicoccaceae bacterium]